MDPEAWKRRTCPQCGSSDYQFRSRKRVAVTETELSAWETKYRCKACQHVWRERVEG